MKICLIIDDYLPSSIKVGAKMMHELAVEFVSLGHSVTVITPAPDLENPYEVSELDGVIICRFRSGQIKNVSKVKRAINETMLSFLAWRVGKRYFQQHPHDLIVYYSPSIFWGRLVSRLKRLWGAQSYLVLRDFFPQWVIDNGLLRKNSLITYYFRLFESICYRAADTIAIQSPKNLEWFASTGLSDKPLALLYNWAALDPVVLEVNRYRKEYNLEDKVVFFYGGNIGHAQDMMNIVRLARAMLSETNAHFLLVGAGDEIELVREAIQKFNLKNMTLIPPVNQIEFKQMLAECDIGLFSLHYDHTTHNFPGKLLGYMVQAKPILGSVNPGNDLQDVLEGSKAGLVSINGEDDNLLENALKLLHNAEFRLNVGKNAKQLLIDTFSVNAAAKSILQTVNFEGLKPDLTNTF